VRGKGLEPSRELPHWNLNPARLPIPPSSREDLETRSSGASLLDVSCQRERMDRPGKAPHARAKCAPTAPPGKLVPDEPIFAANDARFVGLGSIVRDRKIFPHARPIADNRSRARPCATSISTNSTDNTRRARAINRSQPNDPAEDQPRAVPTAFRLVCHDNSPNVDATRFTHRMIPRCKHAFAHLAQVTKCRSYKPNSDAQERTRAHIQPPNIDFPRVYAIGGAYV
jgi:hypothetical protein